MGVVRGWEGKDEVLESCTWTRREERVDRKGRGAEGVSDGTGKGIREEG